MKSGLKIHEFSGTIDDVKDALKISDTWFENNYPASESKGWASIGTRARGLLAILLYTYPDMPLDAIAAWCYWNDVPEDWEFDTESVSGGPLVGQSGTIWFLDEFPLPSDWSSIWDDWKNNYDLGDIDPNNRALSPWALPAPAPAPAPAPSEDEFSEDDTDETDWEEYYLNNVDSLPSPSSSPATTQPATIQPAVISTTVKPSAAPKPKEDNSMLPLLLIGGAVAFFMLSKK